MIRGVIIFSFLTIPLIFQNNFLQLSPTEGLTLVYITIVISVLISVFAPPSAYCASAVKPDHIKTVCTLLHESNITSLEQLAPIRSNISIFERRIQQRLLCLRGVLALIWAGYLFGLSKLDLFTPKQEASDITFLVLSAFAILGLYLTIESYSKTQTLIFRSMQFGCNEYEYSIASPVK